MDRLYFDPASPTDNDFYTLNLAPWAAAGGDTTVTGLSVAVTPAGPTIVSSSINALNATVRLTGLSLGVNYTIAYTFTGGQSGRTVTRYRTVYCQKR